MELGLTDRIVVVGGTSADDLDACAAALSAEGAETLRVESFDGLAPAVITVLREHGRIDGVVVHLPAAVPTSVLDRGLAGLVRAWEPVEAVAEAYRAALPAMIEQGRGRLVSVLTGAVKWLSDDTDEPGAVAGAAVLGLHKAVVADAARHGVTVNAVLRDASTDAAAVAETVTFLLSDPAGYLQGVTIGLDGARSPSMF